MTEDSNQPSVGDIVRRPGPGWRHVGGAVWDHDSGMRLHMLGMIRFPDDSYKSASEWPSSAIADSYVRIAGGNHRRGLMMWAVVMLRIHRKVKRLGELMKSN